MDRDKLEQIIMEELHSEGWRDNLGKATGAFKKGVQKFKQFNLKQVGDFGEKFGNIGGRYVTRDPNKKNPRSWTRGEKRNAIIDFKRGVACSTASTISEEFAEQVNALIDSYYPIKRYGPTGAVCGKEQKKGSAGGQASDIPDEFAGMSDEEMKAAGKTRNLSTRLRSMVDNYEDEEEETVTEKVGKSALDRAGSDEEIKAAQGERNLTDRLEAMIANYEGTDEEGEGAGKLKWNNAYKRFDREMRENGMLYMLDSETRIQFGKEMYQLWQEYGGIEDQRDAEERQDIGQVLRGQLKASLAGQGLTPEQEEETINTIIDQLKASDVPISEQFVAKFKTRLIEKLSEEDNPDDKEDDERDNLAAKVIATVREGEQRFYNIQTAAKSSAGLIAGFEFYRILLKLQKILDNDALTSDEGKQVLKKLSAFSNGGPIKMPEKVPLPEEKEEDDKSAGAKFGRPGSFKDSKRAGPRPAAAAGGAPQHGRYTMAGRMTKLEKKLDQKILNVLETFEAFGLGANPETDPAKYKALLRKVSKLKKGGPGEKVPLPGKDEKTTAADMAPEKGKLKVSGISQKLASDGVDKEVIKKAMDALKKDLGPLLKQFNVKLSEQQKEMFKSKLREEIVRRELIK